METTMTAARRQHLRADLIMAFSSSQTADWFTAQLFRLIAKADGANRARLAEGFPDEVEVYEEYLRGD